MDLYSHIIQNQNELNDLYQVISQNTILLKPLTTTYTNLMAYIAIKCDTQDKARLKEPCYSLTIENQTIHLIYDPTYVYQLQERLQKINL